MWMSPPKLDQTADPLHYFLNVPISYAGEKISNLAILSDALLSKPDYVPAKLTGKIVMDINQPSSCLRRTEAQRWLHLAWRYAS